MKRCLLLQGASIQPFLSCQFFLLFFDRDTKICDTSFVEFYIGFGFFSSGFLGFQFLRSLSEEVGLLVDVVAKFLNPLALIGQV